MAYRLTNNASALQRITGLVAASSDFTCILNFNIRSTTAGSGLKRIAYLYSDATAAPHTDFAGMLTAVNSNLMGLQAGGTSSGTVNLQTNLFLNFTYRRSGTLHEFWYGSSYIGSFTDDISALTFAASYIGGDGTTTKTDVNLAYYREWSASLNINAITIEWHSSRAVHTDDLVIDLPLVSDLTDISGNGLVTTDMGPAGSFITDIPASLVDISGETFPFARLVTTAEFNVANEFWFKYTPTDVVAFSTVVPFTSWSITRRLKRSDSYTEVAFWDTNAGYIMIGPGDYYIGLFRTDGGSIPSDFTITFGVQSIENADVEAGDYIINDDTGGFPATVYDTDGTFKGFLYAIPGSELGAMLPNGISLWHDRHLVYQLDFLILLDADFDLIASVETTPLPLNVSAAPCCICHNFTDFYVLVLSNHEVCKVTQAGVLTNIGVDIFTFSDDPYAFGVNLAGTIGYWAEGPSAPYAIHRWDLVGNVVMSDLYVTPITNGYVAITTINHHNGEIIVLADDTVVTWYYDADTDENTIVHLQPDGTLLAAHTLSGDYTSINHIDRRIDTNTISVWFYFSDSYDGQGRFGILDLTTGLLTAEFNTAQFSTGTNQNTASSTLFGPSISCTMVTAGGTTGTVVVVKDVNPSTDTTSFPFVAGGGLSPTDFSLAHGESYTFEDVSAGSGYTIEETVPDGWTVSYSVSNGSPIDDLEVVAGETTTVTVTNGNSVLGFATELPIRWVLRSGVIT